MSSITPSAGEPNPIQPTPLGEAFASSATPPKEDHKISISEYYSAIHGAERKFKQSLFDQAAHDSQTMQDYFQAISERSLNILSCGPKAAKEAQDKWEDIYIWQSNLQLAVGDYNSAIDRLKTHTINLNMAIADYKAGRISKELFQDVVASYNQVVGQVVANYQQAAGRYNTAIAQIPYLNSFLAMSEIKGLPSEPPAPAVALPYSASYLLTQNPATLQPIPMPENLIDRSVRVPPPVDVKSMVDTYLKNLLQQVSHSFQEMNVAQQVKERMQGDLSTDPAFKKKAEADLETGLEGTPIDIAFAEAFGLGANEIKEQLHNEAIRHSLEEAGLNPEDTHGIAGQLLLLQLQILTGGAPPIASSMLSEQVGADESNKNGESTAALGGLNYVRTLQRLTSTSFLQGQVRSLVESNESLSQLPAQEKGKVVQNLTAILTISLLETGLGVFDRAGKEVANAESSKLASDLTNQVFSKEDGVITQLDAAKKLLQGNGVSSLPEAPGDATLIFRDAILNKIVSGSFPTVIKDTESPTSLQPDVGQFPV